MVTCLIVYTKCVPLPQPVPERRMAELKSIKEVYFLVNLVDMWNIKK